MYSFDILFCSGAFKSLNIWCYASLSMLLNVKYIISSVVVIHRSIFMFQFAPPVLLLHLITSWLIHFIYFKTPLFICFFLLLLCLIDNVNMLQQLESFLKNKLDIMKLNWRRTETTKNLIKWINSLNIGFTLYRSTKHKAARKHQITCWLNCLSLCLDTR